MRTIAADSRPRVLRRALVTVGILPAVVALAMLGKVAVMMSHDEDGRAAFGDADFAAAADDFAANRTWNWFEPWVAPFDEGTARHADGSYDEAMDLYEQALETVPEIEECTVRINLALANEALGDLAADDAPPDHDLATEYWQAGIDALAAGDCPQDSGRGAEQTQDAKDVDQRLRDKLEQQQQQEQEQQQQNQPDRSDHPPGEERSQQQELEERNDKGREDRSDHQDRDGEGGGGPQGGTGGTPRPGW